jgi:hypothetical protein
LRRLARDHPEILDRYEAGEFPSVRAAAREAGIVKDISPFEQVRRLLEKHAGSFTASQKAPEVPHRGWTCALVRREARGRLVSRSY